MRGVGLICHTTPISLRDLAAKTDVKHAGVSVTRSCLVGPTKHAIAGPPPSGSIYLNRV